MSNTKISLRQLSSYLYNYIEVDKDEDVPADEYVPEAKTILSFISNFEGYPSQYELAEKLRNIFSEAFVHNYEEGTLMVASQEILNMIEENSK